MTKNSAVKRAARDYQDEHGVPYTVALRRTKPLKVGERVREIPGEGDIKQMPIGVVDFIYITTYDVRYPDGKMSVQLHRNELEAVTI